jgi:hypothetical protein
MSPSQHNKACQIGHTHMRNEGKTQAVEVFRGRGQYISVAISLGSETEVAT